MNDSRIIDLEQLSKNESWDELISVATKILALEAEPSAKAQVYFRRGHAYFNKGGHVNNAIADFTKALELDPNCVEAYFWQGLAYLGKKNYDKARENFNHVLTNDPNDREAYYFLGTIDHQEENTEEAIRNFDKALELSPQSLRLEKKYFYAVVHRWRGLAYINKEDFRQAYEDFKESDKKDPSFKSKNPEIYIATRIDEIYGEENGGGTAFELFALYYVLLYAVFSIRNLLLYSPGKGQEVAHYTSLHTLKSLADTAERFRFYNTAYMNDPEEGIGFFEIMKKFGIDDVENVFYKDTDRSYPSPAYIGSFVKAETEADTGNPNRKDKLFLWRTYGKHDGQEAAGACLIFKHDGAVFAKQLDRQIGDMQQLHLSSDTPSRPPQKPCLYQIVYSNTQGEIVDDNKEFKKELEDKLNPLKESLLSIKEHIEKEPDDKKKELKRLVRDVLDIIRFLFKASHYSEEKEVRVVQIRYLGKSGEDGIQVDTEQIPPRFYLEAHEDVRFGEAILGPQTRRVPEWTRWLEKFNVTVTKSNIPYTQGS